MSNPLGVVRISFPKNADFRIRPYGDAFQFFDLEVWVGDVLLMTFVFSEDEVVHSMASLNKMEELGELLLRFVTNQRMDDPPPLEVMPDEAYTNDVTVLRIEE